MAVYETRKTLESKLTQAGVRFSKTAFIAGNRWINIYGTFSGQDEATILEVARQMKVNVELYSE